MPNIAFERPVLVIAALFSPLVIAVVRRFFRDAFSLYISLGPPGGEAFSAPFRASLPVKFVRLLRYAAVMTLLLAASGPVLLTKSYIYLDRGADILFVLDDSPSMAGIDIGGKNRFDASRELIKEFSRKRPADAIGLVIVGDDAALLIPPTTDRETLFTRLDALKIGEAGDGTALGMGISVAALHLSKSTARRKAVVLITDGENNAGAVHPETAAALLTREGVMLYVIAVGSGGEVPIDYVDPYTHIRRTGSFDSHFNPDSLIKITIVSNGIFIPAPSLEAFEEAFSLINKEEMIVSRSALRGKRTPVHSALLLATLIIFLVVFFFKRIILGAFL